jgi:O-antigen ligase
MQALLACALMAAVLAFSPASPVKRILSPGYGDEVSTEDHKALWRFGANVALQYPLLGIGLGNFKSASAAAHITERLDGYEAHNTYIHLAAETGVPGFLLYLSVGVSAFILLQQAKRRARMLRHLYLHNLASGMQLGLIGFSVAAFFVSAQTEKPFWILISLTATMPLVIRQQVARWKTQQARTWFTVNPRESELVPAGD